MVKNFFLKFITFLLISNVILTCSKNEPIKIGPIASCFDGIMNGSETDIDCGGTCVIVCPPSDKLQGEIVSVLELNASVEYLLKGPLLIRDGASLLIPAGTVIKVEPGVNAYIAVAQGGQIRANGQSDNPIVITSNAANPAPGDWGGLIFAGRAPINTKTVDRTEIIDIFYGGTTENDSSGVIKYLRVEYAGAQFDVSKKFSAISFYGVGDFTTFEYVQVIHALGDNIKFIGGTINPKWIVSTNTNENAFHITDGWNGQGDSWYIKDAQKSGIKIGNNPSIEDLSPITTANLQKISMIGPFVNGAINYGNGGALAVLDNIFTSGLNLGINVNGQAAAAQIDMNSFTINTIQFANPSNGFIPTNHAGINTAFYTEGDNLGAGNEEGIPSWAMGWTTGF